MAHGILAHLLFEHLTIHSPYIFDEETFAEGRYPFAKIIRESNAESAAQQLDADPVAYFKFAVSTHWVTAGSFVPMDLDPHLRVKLWHAMQSEAQLDEIARWLLNTLTWDVAKISKRFMRFDKTRTLSTHQGEWMLLIACAYRAIRARTNADPELLQELLDSLKIEVYAELELLEHTFNELSGTRVFDASACLAHNLGDLFRVEQLWPCVEGDPLTGLLQEISCGRYRELIAKNQRFYQECGAAENHRHLGLRSVKALRGKIDLIPGFGPFWDTWGSQVAHHPELDLKDQATLVEALYHGWVRLFESGPKAVTHSYPRAVHGIFQNVKGGRTALLEFLPARTAKEMKMGVFNSLVQTEKARFEASHLNRAFKIIRESQSVPQQVSSLQTSL